MSHEHHETPAKGSSQASPIPGHHPHARRPAAPDATRRLDVFIIDSGWNAAISTALTKNLSQIRVYLEEDTIYIVDQPRSIALLKSNPHLIGHDPMILFLDRRFWFGEQAADVLRLCDASTGKVTRTFDGGFA